ncbi:phage antirepressor KilAC domain-containing protein [Saccharopolyspora sp. NPDC003762]
MTVTALAAPDPIPTSWHYGSHQVRTLVLDGQPWFVTADVCRVLQLTNPTTAVGRLAPDDLSTTEVIDSMGRRQRANIVSEAGLYELVFQSRKAAAKAFTRWITHEVLPAIRRTGRYDVAERHQVPQSFADALELAARQARELEATRAQVAELEPAAAAWEQLADAAGDYSVREAAQLLNRAGIRTGQQRLFATLRKLGWIDRRGTPYQQHVTASRLALRTGAYEHPHTGESRLTVQVRITPTGLRALRDRLAQTSLPL